MIALEHLLPAALAVLVALGIACQNVFVRLGTDRGEVSAAVFVVMLTNVAILGPPILLRYYPSYGLTPVSVASFVAAGVAGSLLGRTLSYASIETIGASLTAPIVASWGLISTVLGVLVLGETVSVAHGVGVVLIVGGVALVARESGRSRTAGPARGRALVGLALPVLAAVAFGWEPIFANVGFAAGTPAPVGLVVKTVAATGGFWAYLRWRGSVPAVTRLGSGSARWFLLAGVANSLSLLGYYVAISVAPVSLITPIIITNTLFVILLSAVAMPSRLERVTPRLVVAATVVVAGVGLLVTQ